MGGHRRDDHYKRDRERGGHRGGYRGGGDNTRSGVKSDLRGRIGSKSKDDVRARINDSRLQKKSFEKVSLSHLDGDEYADMAPLVKTSVTPLARKKKTNGIFGGLNQLKALVASNEKKNREGPTSTNKEKKLPLDLNNVNNGVHSIHNGNSTNAGDLRNRISNKTEEIEVLPSRTVVEARRSPSVIENPESPSASSATSSESEDDNHKRKKRKKRKKIKKGNKEVRVK